MMNDVKLRTRIDRGVLSADDLCRAYWLQAMIRQAKRDEADGGYEPGELSGQHERDLHDLLQRAADAMKERGR